MVYSENDLRGITDRIAVLIGEYSLNRAYQFGALEEREAAGSVIVMNEGEFLDYWNTQEENNMDNNTEVRTDAIAPTNYERVSFLMKYLDHLIEANVNGINSINEIDAVREELNKELRVEVKQGKQRGTMGNAKG